MWENIIPYIMTGVFSGGFVGGGVAVYNALQSRRARVSGDERDARRDLALERDGLYDRMNARLTIVEERLERRDSQFEKASDHINKLEAFIWAGHQPPPPERPEGI